MPDVLRFKGRITGDEDMFYGSDRKQRRFAIRSISYDEVADISTVRLRAIPADEHRERVMKRVDEQEERARIRGLFHG